MELVEDEDLILLRSQILKSMRSQKGEFDRQEDKKKHKQRRDHHHHHHQRLQEPEIFDTDIDDLDALRNACLKTRRAKDSSIGSGSGGSSPSRVPQLRPTQGCPQFSTLPSAYQPKAILNQLHGYFRDKKRLDHRHPRYGTADTNTSSSTRTCGAGAGGSTSAHILPASDQMYRYGPPGSGSQSSRHPYHFSSYNDHNSRTSRPSRSTLLSIPTSEHWDSGGDNDSKSSPRCYSRRPRGAHSPRGHISHEMKRPNQSSKLLLPPHRYGPTSDIDKTKGINNNEKRKDKWNRNRTRSSSSSSDSSSSSSSSGSGSSGSESGSESEEERKNLPSGGAVKQVDQNGSGKDLDMAKEGPNNGAGNENELEGKQFGRQLDSFRESTMDHESRQSRPSQSHHQENENQKESTELQEPTEQNAETSTPAYNTAYSMDEDLMRMLDDDYDGPIVELLVGSDEEEIGEAEDGTEGEQIAHSDPQEEEKIERLEVSSGDEAEEGEVTDSTEYGEEEKLELVVPEIGNPSQASEKRSPEVKKKITAPYEDEISEEKSPTSKRKQPVGKQNKKLKSELAQIEKRLGKIHKYTEPPHPVANRGQTIRRPKDSIRKIAPSDIKRPTIGSPKDSKYSRKHGHGSHFSEEDISPKYSRVMNERHTEKHQSLMPSEALHRKHGTSHAHQSSAKRRTAEDGDLRRERSRSRDKQFYHRAGQRQAEIRNHRSAIVDGYIERQDTFHETEGHDGKLARKRPTESERSYRKQREQSHISPKVIQDQGSVTARHTITSASSNSYELNQRGSVGMPSSDKATLPMAKKLAQLTSSNAIPIPIDARKKAAPFSPHDNDKKQRTPISSTKPYSVFGVPPAKGSNLIKESNAKSKLQNSKANKVSSTLSAKPIGDIPPIATKGDLRNFLKSRPKMVESENQYSHSPGTTHSEMGAPHKFQVVTDSTTTNARSGSKPMEQATSPEVTKSKKIIQVKTKDSSLDTNQSHAFTATGNNTHTSNSSDKKIITKRELPEPSSTSSTLETSSGKKRTWSPVRFVDESSIKKFKKKELKKNKKEPIVTKKPWKSTRHVQEVTDPSSSNSNQTKTELPQMVISTVVGEIGSQSSSRRIVVSDEATESEPQIASTGMFKRNVIAHDPKPVKVKLKLKRPTFDNNTQ